MRQQIWINNKPWGLLFIHYCLFIHLSLVVFSSWYIFEARLSKFHLYVILVCKITRSFRLVNTFLLKTSGTAWEIGWNLFLRHGYEGGKIVFRKSEKMLMASWLQYFFVRFPNLAAEHWTMLSSRQFLKVYSVNVFFLTKRSSSFKALEIYLP